MPGIVVAAGRGPEGEAARLVERMVRSMCHERFYVHGTHVDERLAVAVGWVARDGSFAARTPVWSPERDLGLVFCGEDFSDGAGADPSYLLDLYRRDGARFVERLNGWFSGVVLDRRAGQAFVFNDRFGLSRLHVHESGGFRLFASEAKAILAVRERTRALADDSLAEFVSNGCPLGGRTLFDGVMQLPGATIATIAADGSSADRRWFDAADWADAPPLSESEYYERLKAAWASAVPRYLRGPERVAVSLTGGVDSRMLMAWARQPAGALPTFTFGGPFRECTDVRIARSVASICGQPHTVIPVADEFLRRFASLAPRVVHLTDGAMDVSGTPDLYVNEIARSIAPVRLTGNYGGEVLRRLVAFKPMRLSPVAFSAPFAAELTAAEHRYAEELLPNPLSFVAFKQVPWHHYSRLCLEQSQLTLRSPYLDNELVALSFRAPSSLATSSEVALRLIADGNPALGLLGTDRGVLHRSLPVIGALRHAYQEFTFKAEYAYDYGMPQPLVRLDRRLSWLHLERLFLGRHKFYHFRYWYRHALAPYVRDVLLDPRSLARPYLDRAAVERMVRAHTTGTGNYTLEIHRLLSLELLHRSLLDGA